MVISLLAFLVNFSRQSYFRRSNVFKLFQSDCFNTSVTLLEQLFLQSSCYFQELLFRKSHFLASVIFSEYLIFWSETSTEQNFLNIGSYLGQLLFGKGTFLAEELLRIKIFTEELLCRSRNNEAQHQLYQKSLFSEKAKFLENEYFAFSIFSGELHFRETTFSKRITQLPFQKSYFLTTYFFRRAAILQISFFSTATLTIYQLVIK